VLGEIHAGVAASTREKSWFCPLEELKNWEIDDWGMRERRREQGFSVGYFEVSAAYREVGRWIQPLVDSHSEGHVILACRDSDAGLEVFVRTLFERGLATGAALAPSYLRYPGSPGEPPEWLARQQSSVWAESVESDEGGRFHRDANRFQIIGCDTFGKEPPAHSGVWVRLSELRHCLMTSNLCSIQLRCIASHLLSIKDA
jgi:oxidase EvaA